MAKLKVPQQLIDEFGHDLAKCLWREWGRNDKERWKIYGKILKREAGSRKWKTELRGLGENQ